MLVLRLRLLVAIMSVFAICACSNPEGQGSGAASVAIAPEQPSPKVKATWKQENERVDARQDRFEPEAKGGDRKSSGADFDFYVLSLSWSPTYCLDAGETADPIQCSSRRSFDFVVHGLWPQYERGYPTDCAPEGDRSGPSAGQVEAMLDIMPSPRLIRHEWRKHGTCSGLSPKSYFAAVRKAREMIAIPKPFIDPEEPVSMSPDALEAAFLRANNGLRAGGISVTCTGRKLREVRICLTQDLEFRTCREVDSRPCRASQVVAPVAR